RRTSGSASLCPSRSSSSTVGSAQSPSSLSAPDDPAAAEVVLAAAEVELSPPEAESSEVSEEQAAVAASAPAHTSAARVGTSRPRLPNITFSLMVEHLMHPARRPRLGMAEQLPDNPQCRLQ